MIGSIGIFRSPADNDAVLSNVRDTDINNSKRVGGRRSLTDGERTIMSNRGRNITGVIQSNNMEPPGALGQSIGGSRVLSGTQCQLASCWILSSWNQALFPRSGSTEGPPGHLNAPKSCPGITVLPWMESLDPRLLFPGAEKFQPGGGEQADHPHTVRPEESLSC